MLKRLLTFALAGILVLETPATAYAAGQNVDQMAAGSTAEASETTDGLSDGDDAQNTGEEYDAPDQTDADKDDSADGADSSDENGEDTGKIENPVENTGNENDASDEGDNAGNENDASDEDGNTGNDNDASDEDDNAGNDNDASDEDGNTGNEENPADKGDADQGAGDPSDENGDTGNENDPADGSGEVGDDQEDPSDQTTPEDVDQKETSGDDDPVPDADSEEAVIETISENDLLAAQVDAEVREDAVTEISYEEASGNGVQVTAPYGEENAARYSFTAPANGRYVFYTEEKLPLTDWIIFDVSGKGDRFNKNTYLLYKTDFLKQGETVTIRSYAQTEADDKCTYTLKAAGQKPLTKAEDGSYGTVLPDGRQLVIDADEGIRHLRYSSTVSGGSCQVWAYYCPNDYSAGDSNFGSMTATETSSFQSTTGSLESGRSYDVAYVIKEDSAGKFVGLYTNTLTTKTSETEEGVYIHNARTDEENKVTLDIEVLGSGSFYCNYAPEDGSLAERKVYLYGISWEEVDFDDLKSGTKYKFEFRNNSDELFRTAEYTTAGNKIEASTTGSSAVISDDFTTMTIKVKPEYSGSATSALLYYNFTDSMNLVQKASRNISLLDKDKDADGYYSVNIPLTDRNVFLLPRETYEVEIYLDFSSDYVTSTPETITVTAPAQAYVDQNAITFTVTQDETTKTKVNYSIQISTTSSAPERGCIYYRPVGTQRYRPYGFYLNSGSASSSISGLSAGAAYEFLLFAGGAVKKQSLKLDTASGIELIRVEDTATDYTGPYDIVRTYKMTMPEGTEQSTESYFLRLQYQENTGSSFFSSAVELNADNNFQATVSTAKFTTMLPDTDHELCWMLGKSSSVKVGGAECCVYETVHTAKAKVTLEAGDGSCNYQTYTVKLDTDDVANIKTNSRGISLYGYIKKEGAKEYTRTGSYSSLGSDNDYSDTLTLNNLEANTRYELSLRDSENKAEYANTTFATSEDQRTVSITSVDSFIDNAVINYALSGFGEQTKDYILCYYREAKADNSGTWKKSDSNYAGITDAKSFRLQNLKENTAYEYKIGIGTSSSTPLSSLAHPVSDRFTTRSDERLIKVTSEKIMITTARIEYSLHNMEYAGNGYVLCYVKEAQSGENGKWECKARNYVSSASGTNTFYLSDLKEKTAYEYKIGFGTYGASVKELKNVVTGSFTTYEDLRKAEVTSVEPRMTSAVLNCAITGMANADEDSQYLVCFVQEKGSAEWKKAYEEYVSVYDDPDRAVMLTGLTSGTEYRYQIGFTRNYGETPENLVNVTEGVFTTYADTRQVEITGTTPRVHSANVAYTLSGMEYAGEGYLLGYVKKKADADTAWTRNFSKEINAQDTDGTISVNRLEEKTAYELVIGFGDRSYDSKENLKHTKTVEFTTLADQRRLSGPKADVKGTSAVLSAVSEGNVEYSDTYVHFFYRVKGAAEYTKAERAVNASKVKEKECSVTLTGLSRGTTYEFVAVLSESGYSCDEPDAVTKAEYKTAVTEFAVAAGTGTPVKPTAVRLSQAKLSLNTNEVYKNARGYGYEILKATVTPANAASGFQWKSSDENIVTVSNGRVTAVAPGTATVTVTSSHNEAASAVCEVTVGNYQIAKKGASGMELLDHSNLNAAKGGKYGGYTVCKMENGSPREVSFKVSSDNQAVVSWNAGENLIMANNTGSTKLVFETEDQVKLYLQVTVGSAPGKGFTVTGFAVSGGYEEYAAIQNAGQEYTLAYTPGISYQAEGEIVPKNPVFDESDFNWTIDKTDVATVDEWGNVTPLKAGDAVLTVTPKEAGDALYTKETCKVTLHIQSLASAELENATPVFALADISSTIGDVKFPDEAAWKGWQWKAPDTPLVINGVNREYYPFEAVYTEKDHYPEETTVNVYIAKITGVSVYEDAQPGHNQVVETGSVDAEKNPAAGSDSLTLAVDSLYYGSLNVEEATNYFYDTDIQAPADVVVKKHEDGTFSVTATKAGSYTLTPVIKVKDKNNSNERILAKTTYKIKAVDASQAYIRLVLQEPVPDGVKLEDDRIVVDHNAKDALQVASFQVKAELTDRNQANAESFGQTKLVWSVTDKKVATVTATSDTHAAEIKVVGEGHTILTAKVKDTAGHKAEFKVEIRNHAPRVNRKDARVNLAYDYDNYKGRWLAERTSGAVEIVPVYGEEIQSVNLYEDADASKLYSGLKAMRGSAQHSWVICPTAETKTGDGNYYLGVKTTFRNELYVYPLKVTVTDQQATVTAKSARTANLFYRSDPGSLDIGIKGVSYGIESVEWTDNASGDGNGFGSEGTTDYSSYDDTKRPKNATRYYFDQEDIQLTADKKLVDTGIVSGTVEVKLGGYKKPNTVVTSLKWNYKKPAVTTVNSSVTLIPAVQGKKSGYFRLYNKTEGRYLEYSPDSYSDSNPKYYYNELVCGNADVRFGVSGSRNYTYTGSKTSGSEKFTVTLSGDDWRESLSASHTIRLASPVPYLTSTKLTVNTNRVGSVYTYVRLKNAYSGSLSCEDIVIQGKDAKAQQLLDEDLLEVRQGSGDASQIVITQNRTSTMKQQAIANGTYSYLVTPCYADADGSRIRSKALSLKIVVTDKAITAKTKAARSLDLTKGIDDYYSTNGNYIRLDTTFRNIGSYYTVTDSELIGEYSEYFNLRYTGRYYDQRLTIANESELKAGQKYKLAIRFTLRMEDGDTFTITGEPFTVKPKQTAAKIKVYNDNQTLYAAADTVSRSYTLQASGGDYRILSVEGSLDCNKDGRPDITVFSSSSYGSSIAATVRITDRDGVLTVTGTKGKTYTIPVTVRLRGRDGITKDVRTSIKVTVKR